MLKRMLKDRQEFLVVGELLMFLLAWVLGVVAAVDDYRVRTNAKTGNDIAATSTTDGGGSSRPTFFQQHGGWE